MTNSETLVNTSTSCVDPEDVRDWGLWKSPVAIGYLRNSGKDPPGGAVGPLWPNCFSREARMTIYEIR